MGFEIEQIRSEFPELETTVHGKPLVYLDNGASALKPKAVIDRIQKYYSFEHANVHRGVHFLSQQATDAYEKARASVRGFLNAPNEHEIIFTKGTTDSINLVARGFGGAFFNEGDEVLVTYMEHHSNIVPWQLICKETGAKVVPCKVRPSGELDMDDFTSKLSAKTKLVAVAHVSNAIGTVNPVTKIISKAHALNVPVLLDGAQSTQHMRIDVQALDCDFFAFSGHKLFGPTGVGVLYGKEKWLNAMNPYQGGGDMIDKVSFEGTTFNDLPHKFEAGTPNIAGVIGLGTAIDYLMTLDWNAMISYEAQLHGYMESELSNIDGFRMIGEAKDKVSISSFLIDDAHPFDIGTILDQLGVAVRTGHHCTQPLMSFFEIPGTVRASLAFYNNEADVNALVSGVKRAAKMLL